MKKHDEGYALVFVVVVMAVLMLVALSVMSLSLRNLQSQQNSIERMEAKYAAQGQVEIIQAELEKISKLSDTHDAVNQTIKGIVGETALQADAEGNYIAWVGDQCEFTFDITAENTNHTASCTITCRIQLKEIKVDNEVKGVSVTYISYTVSTEMIGGDS